MKETTIDELTAEAGGSQLERVVSEWTIDEVTRFAAEQNHEALYQFCQLHIQNPHMWTWEQVMQAAAVGMAKQLERTRKMLIDCQMRSPATPMVAR